MTELTATRRAVQQATARALGTTHYLGDDCPDGHLPTPEILSRVIREHFGMQDTPDDVRADPDLYLVDAQALLGTYGDVLTAEKWREICRG
jgi:hypothetical protein